MKLNRTRAIVATIIIAAVTFAFLLPAGATLIGDTITATGYQLGPGTATIGAGIEFIAGDSIDLLNFDFDAGTLTVTRPGTTVLSYYDFGDYVFSDFDDIITGLSVASNTGFTGPIGSNLRFAAHSITLDMSGGIAHVDDVLVFNITTEPIPEPTTVLLLGSGLVGLAGFRRRFRK